MARSRRIPPASRACATDTAAEQFIYVWKTPKSLATRCANAIVSLTDDSTQRARFEFR